MYITCEQCSTIFRLDERRIKPEGSKVRCSQCGRVFVAYPPVAAPPDQPLQAAGVAAAATAPPAQPEDTFDRELEGIDLAELDSILEQDRAETAFGDDSSPSGGNGPVAAEAHELDESDLDLDFEAALDLDEEAAATAPVEATPTEAAEQDEEEPDLDMDFELDSEAPVVAEAQAADSSELDADVLAMDFELDEAGSQPGEAPEPGGAVDTDEEIDLALDDFEEALTQAEETAGPEAVSTADADEELSLDMDIDLEQQAEPAAAMEEAPPAGTDEIPVESGKEEPEIAADDLGLGDLEDILREETAELDIDEAEDEELELSLDEDAELSLDEEPAFELESELPAEAGSDDAAGAKAGSDEFDLDDLGDLLDAEESQERAPAADEELELSLDEAGPEKEESPLFSLEEEEGAGQGAGGSEKPADDFDLGGLDALLDEVDAVTQQASEDEELELDLDTDDQELELDLEAEPAPDAAADQTPADSTPEALEELEFELDAEFEDKPISKKAAEDSDQVAAGEDTAEDEELDLSDIEKMLEDDSFVPEPVAPGTDSDSDLAAGAEKWSEDNLGGDLGLGTDGEIDLSEIEAAIDSADEEADTGVGADEELRLDLEPEENEALLEDEALDLQLEMESEPATPDDELLQEDTEEIDLSDLDLSIEEDTPEVESEVIDAGDMELEFQIEQDDQEVEPLAIEEDATLVAGQTTTSFAQTSTGAGVGEESDEALIQEAFTAPKPAPKAEPKRAPARKKKGSSKFLIVLLVLALLGGGGYYGYDYVMKNNIQIPYLSDFLNPKPKDPQHIAKLSTLEINSKFIENTSAGRLFVVTGKVRNGYTLPCKLIRLQGKLFTKGKVLAKTEHVYAGMIISDQELTSLPLDQIKQRLGTPSGQVGTIVANPGQSLPFMVVFSNLPADLDEFAVELVSSAQAR